MFIHMRRAHWFRVQSHPRRLSPEQTQAVLDILHEPRFIDQSPMEIYAQLLDEDQYLCSIRTMYRILGRNAEVRDRRRQREHPKFSKPELIATAPNKVWSWDITKLHGPAKWTYFYLYVVLDIFSRKAVGWLLAERESASLASRLVAEICEREGINQGDLLLHMDRGPAMKSKLLSQTLGILGVTKSHSRPYVSDDNPFSESQFKTLKYRPDFPERFASLAEAEAFCRDFFAWYNHEHHHVSLGLMTPHDIHAGLAHEKWDRRAKVLAQAYASHPERYPRGCPKPPPLPTEVWINKPLAAANAQSADQRAPKGAQADGAVVTE